MLFTLFVLILGIGLAVFGVRALVRWHAGWRWAALAPLLVVLVNVLTIAVDIRADPTSHNLWPFEVLAMVVIASAVLGAIELCRVVVTRHARRTSEDG
jgi:hypothetical protein